MADFRDFLAKPEPVVLPYFGGTRVDAADRRLRVEGELAVGWWRFRIEGRRAVAVEPAEAVELGALPRVRGHWVDGWIVVDGREIVRVALAPDDDPAPLARVAARRWYSGDLVFDELELEDDPELEARRLLEERGSLAGVRGAVPSLRVAFGLARGADIAKELGFPTSVRELLPRAAEIADHGPEALREWLARLEEERRRAEEEARRRAAELRLREAAGSARTVRRSDDAVRRADDALDGARARMIACRRLQRGATLDVTWEVDGTRILTMIEADTLQVVDPGVCLGHDGEYRVLTLDAMPSVVREAIESGRLNITRRG